MFNFIIGCSGLDSAMDFTYDPYGGELRSRSKERDIHHQTCLAEDRHAVERDARVIRQRLRRPVSAWNVGHSVMRCHYVLFFSSEG